jgi:hypothetical protein
MKQLIMGEGLLSITPLNSVKEVQEQFSGMFPFLKMIFFKNTGNRTGGHRVLYYPDVKMKDIYPDFAGSEWKIRDSMTIAEFENGILEHVGLNVQVLRKSGNLWLGTARTNSWTLKEQNDHGREISPEQKGETVKIKEIPYRRNLG